MSWNLIKKLCKSGWSCSSTCCYCIIGYFPLRKQRHFAKVHPVPHLNKLNKAADDVLCSFLILGHQMEPEDKKIFLSQPGELEWEAQWVLNELPMISWLLFTGRRPSQVEEIRYFFGHNAVSLFNLTCSQRVFHDSIWATFTLLQFQPNSLIQ